MPEGQAIGKDVDAPVVSDGHVDVHVGDRGHCGRQEKRPRGTACSSGPARAASTDAASNARGAVVPEKVEPA